MREKKKLILLLSTLPLIIGWSLFNDKATFMVNAWGYLGLDITDKYDFFLLVDHPQKLKWYIHYSAYFYTLDVLSWLYWKESGLSGISKRIAAVFFWFSVFRGIEYFLFRFDISILSPIVGVLLFSFYVYKR